MLGVNLENRLRLQVCQEDSALNLRLHDVVVHLIAQVGVRVKHRDLQIRVQGIGAFSK
jgi:hypothetical protein